MTDRKGVLVRFTPDLLADLDAEAKRTGKSRNDIIVDRCAYPMDRKKLDAKIERRSSAAPPAASSFGPVPSVPGSRLKKR